MQGDGEFGEEQQKKLALDIFLKAWDRACEAGIDADILCEVLVYMAVTDLVADRGEEIAASLFDNLTERILDGEFTLGEPGDA